MHGGHPVIPIGRKLKAVVVTVCASCVGNVKLGQVFSDSFVFVGRLKAIYCVVGKCEAANDSAKGSFKNKTAVKNFAYPLNRANFILRSVVVAVCGYLVTARQDVFFYELAAQWLTLFDLFSDEIKGTFQAVFVDRFKKPDIVTASVIVAERHSLAFSPRESQKVVFYIHKLHCPFLLN